jgi:hypothetical protein
MPAVDPSKVRAILDDPSLCGADRTAAMWEYLRYDTDGLFAFEDTDIDHLTAYELAAAAGYDHDEEDCPHCDGTGDNRTDPDYAYPAPCYACSGSGISRVMPPAREEEREPVPWGDGYPF